MRKRSRTIAQWALAAAGAGLLVWQLPALMTEAAGLSDELARLRWGWVLAAVVLGVGGLAAYAELHRRLLMAGGVRLPVRTAQAINFAENALSTTLPAVGNAAGFVYATYQLRKRQVDVALAAWSLVLSGVVATIVLLLLGLLGAGWAGLIPALAAGALAAGVALGAWACWAVVTRPAVLHRCLLGSARLVRRSSALGRTRWHSWASDPDATAQRMSGRIGLLRPSMLQWSVIAAVAVLSWVMDLLSLFASAAALGVAVPWSALVLGFLVVQGAIALQIFPGGAGLAEAGLLGVLVASGVPIASAMATVLVYRIINWLGLAVLGWIVYAVQIHMAPLPERAADPGASSSVPGTASDDQPPRDFVVDPTGPVPRQWPGSSWLVSFRAGGGAHGRR
jgi:putative heme transporter